MVDLVCVGTFTFLATGTAAGGVQSGTAAGGVSTTTEAGR